MEGQVAPGSQKREGQGLGSAREPKKGRPGELGDLETTRGGISLLHLLGPHGLPGDSPDSLELPQGIYCFYFSFFPIFVVFLIFVFLFLCSFFLLFLLFFLYFSFFMFVVFLFFHFYSPESSCETAPTKVGGSLVRLVRLNL